MDIDEQAALYGYTYARICARKGAFLRRETLDDLLRVSTVDGMIEILNRTSFRPYIESLMTGYRGVRLISEAAYSRYADAVVGTYGIMPPTDRDGLSVISRRVYIWNLKHLLLEKREGTQLDERSFIPLPPFDATRLRYLREASEDVVLAFARSLGFDVKRKYDGYFRFVEDLERSYYGFIRSLGGDLSDLSRRMIDLKNIDLVLRGQDAFLEGGSLSLKFLRSLLSRSVEERVDALGLRDVYEERKGDLILLEDALYRRFIRWALREGHSHPFTPLSPIAYVLRMEWEAKTVSGIAALKGIFPEEDLRSMVIM